MQTLTPPKTVTIEIPASYYETIKPFTDAAGITVESYLADLVSLDVEEVQTSMLPGKQILFNIADIMLCYADDRPAENQLRAKLERLCAKIVRAREG